MKPSNILIPAILSPATLIALLWWLVFIGGLFSLVGGAKSGNRREIETGLYCFLFCVILYWVVSTVIPYLMTV